MDGEDVEGLDSLAGAAFNAYPIDSVFVRTEQRTLAEVVKRIEAGRYTLDPEFQRDFVWTPDRQSRLIESCLMRIPLPVFYVAEEKNGRIVVVDGLQRLTTFRMFLADEFALTGLATTDGESKHPLEGKYFSQLPVNMQERVEDTQLTVYILDPKAPERAKLDIFDRVNSGVPLSRQQMRNSLYNGPATVWLRNAARSEAFQKATGGSLDVKSMRDREAINRFCAFHLLGYEDYRSSDMDGYLAAALTKMNEMSASDLETMREHFDRSMRLNYMLFGEHSFRKSLTKGAMASRSKPNISFFDVASTYFSLPKNAEKAEANPDEVRERVSSVLGKQPFIEAITYSTNSTRSVQRRFALFEQALG